MENYILLTSTYWHYGYLTSSGIVEGTSTSLNSYSDLIDCDGYDTLTILAAVWRTVQPCCLFYKEDGSIAGTFLFDMDASQSVTNARIYEIDIPEDAKTFRTTCFNTHKEKWFASLKKGKGVESLVHDALYSHKTIIPVWSGGNPINLSDNQVGDQIRFGISASSAKTYFHTDKATSFFPLPPPGENNINYQHLTIKIELTDLSLNSESAVSYTEPQEKHVIDHGILALPKSYTPDGEATRLIIFTHGAGVYYDTNNMSFKTGDIKPEYWLSEGYAIMDMDGTITGLPEYDNEKNYGVAVNNNDNNNDGTKHGTCNDKSNRNHFYEPDAINSYETAYNWVIKHFNIKRDGVFSAGRSMGGGMQFVLAKSSSIPILASAAIVPFIGPLGYASCPTSTQTRKELLKAYGVENSSLSLFTSIVRHRKLDSSTDNYIYKEDPNTNLDYYNSLTAEEERYYPKFYELTAVERQLLLSNQWRYAPYSPGYMFNRPLTENEVTLWERGRKEWISEDLDDFYDSVKNAVNVCVYKNVPFMLFTCLNDQRIWYNSVKCYFKLLTYGGANVQMRIYPALSNENEAHHFEINPNNCITNFTNSKGESLSNVPKVYVEILRFGRRNE